MSDELGSSITGPSRRRFLALAAGGAAAVPLLTSCGSGTTTTPAASSPALTKPAAPQRGSHPNIVFVFTDQERYFPSWPTGLSLPARERLAKEGVTFHNHYSSAVMCTSSRAVLLTGLQTPDNGMFENADLPYVKAMSTAVPTIGHLLRKAGYYTAYQGKWHLDAAFDREPVEQVLTDRMDAYGFSDFGLPIDSLAHDLGGYTTDSVIAAGAQSWLRNTGRPMADDGKPWALFVSLINPHDIMYFNTDKWGEHVQDTGTLLMHAARAPEHALYQQRWDSTLPANLEQSMQEPGRPAAPGEFLKAWAYTLGAIPPEPDRWQRFTDFYLNSIRSVDQQLSLLLDELDNLALRDNTIVVFTSDHGEMAGAHGLRGKGPFAYQEAIHLPMHVLHPDVKGGQDLHALTSHIDMVPSLLAMAGVAPADVDELAGRALPGKDFTAALSNPSSADAHAVRDSVLFTYSGLATNDSDAVKLFAEAKAAGQDPRQLMQTSGFRPDLTKRGSLRTMFDGRYKFSRYFAPAQRNVPTNLDDLYRFNDVELYDLQSDPAEMTNLAATKGQHADVVMAASTKLEAVIKSEIGVDDGREMPQFGDIDWQIDRMDL
ncbi:sulfatase-like hydrolase/transferase [Mycolicibacterium rhodesiae]|uniref:Sulfatase n=1 Tax=Mycolicibacterium rhodesiae TaxID=36814 RepID=A0A1X0J4N7_MYCRH|nr:sulfatase-like hydrolase/transferase [Mycolicibacterium rhodesiae]MCV7345552.1 sulfatase-like hydrolase/transferase [Mycolicibacterium rhodesiae]ORB56951.1 sulfatase [Mycolicibacterium rhodesiae]